MDFNIIRTFIDDLPIGIRSIFCRCKNKPITSSVQPTPTTPKRKVVAVKPLTLNRTSMANVSFESLPWSEPKSPRGQPRSTTNHPMKTGISAPPASSSLAKDRKDSGKSAVSQFPETLDYTGEVSLEGSPDQAHPLLNSYATHTKEGRPITLHVLRASKDKSWADNVKLAVESAILDWRKLEGPFVRYVGFATVNSAFAVLAERSSAVQSAKEYFMTSQDETEKRQLIIELARGLEILHKADLCHGRLEPRHVLVHYKDNRVRDKGGRDKGVRLSGVGLIQLVEEEFRKVNPEYVKLGRYTDPRPFKESSKPRLIGKQASAGVQSDVYCFGLVALELLTGKVPFASITQDDDATREIERGRLPPAEEYGNFMDDPWWKLLWPCISKEAKSRPSMSDVHKRLSLLLM